MTSTSPAERLGARQTRPRRTIPPLGRWVGSAGTLLGLLILIAIFGALRPDAFLTVNNFMNVLEQSAILAIVAVVQTIVMVVNDFDLSVGATASLSGAVTATAMVNGAPIPAAIVIGIVAGVLIGMLNGFLVGYLGLSAFVATLAMMTSVTGLSFLVTNGAIIFGLPTEFFAIGGSRGLLGIPTAVVISAVVAILVGMLMAYTTFGRRLHAVGGNPSVADLSGINVRRTRFTAFVVAGAGAALAGIVLTSRLQTAAPSAGDALLLNSIAAVFLGMTMFRGGVPNVVGTLIGVAILGVLGNGLNILQVSSYVQQVATGLIIILAVGLSRISAKPTTSH
jgi:ribose transport system permease protein